MESVVKIDWLRFAVDLSPMLMILITSIAILVMAVVERDEESSAAPLIYCVGSVFAFVLSWYLWPNAAGKGAATLIFDKVTVVGWMVVIMAGLFAALLSIPYLSADRRELPEYYGLLAFSVFGMGLLIAAEDLLTMLLGLEIMSLPAYVLVAYYKDRPASIEAGIKYFITGAFATAFFVMGISFVFGSLGSTDLQLVSARVPEISSISVGAFFMFGVAMILIGFAFKVAAVPFHTWAPDAYDGAPTPVASFLSTGMKAAAFFAFIRFSTMMVKAYDVHWHHLVFALSAATMFVGCLAAIRQDSMKRMLAYSSISHAGFILIAFPSIAVDPSAAMRAVVLYLIAYTLMTAGAFAAVVAIGRSSDREVEIHHLEGLSRRSPLLAALFSLFLISLAGFPPTLGFLGKYYLFLTAVKNGDIIIVLLAVFASAVSIYFYLRPVVVMYFREDRERGKTTIAERFWSSSPFITAVLLVAAMAVVAFGIMPENLVAFVRASVP